MIVLSKLSLTSLQAIEAVARHGTLQGAAQALGITVGAVSQRISKAEDALGLALFTRESRGMRLTDAGEAMDLHLAPAFRHLWQAVEAATRDRNLTLTVSVAPIFASRWLVQRIPKFYAKHPEVRVRIDSTTELVDPNIEDVDLCLRIGHGPYPDVRAERLFDQRVMPVCAPEMAATLATPAELVKVPIIRDINAAITWEDWLGPEGLEPSILGGGPEFSDGSLAFYAAMGGAGVFLAWETLDLEAMAAGRVVAPFDPKRHPTGQSYWLVSAKDRAPGHAQAYFTRWMKEELAADGIALA